MANVTPLATVQYRYVYLLPVQNEQITIPMHYLARWGAGTPLRATACALRRAELVFQVEGEASRAAPHSSICALEDIVPYQYPPNLGTRVQDIFRAVNIICAAEWRYGVSQLSGSGGSLQHAHRVSKARRKPDTVQY